MILGARINDENGHFVVADTVQNIRDQFGCAENLMAQYASKFSFLNPDSRWVLVTGHRRESFGPGIESICHAIKEIVKKHDDVEVIYPVHLNPKVRDVVYDILGNSITSNKRIHLTDPLDYFSFVYLLVSSDYVNSIHSILAPDLKFLTNPTVCNNVVMSLNGHLFPPSNYIF